jgi:tRNA(Ile)-lysidine synthase
MAEESEKSVPLVERVARYLDRCAMLPADTALVVGVSGGADSVAMLAVLRELSSRPDRRWALTVAHLNHALREEADREARFVTELAERWGLPCVSERIDVAEISSQRRCGLEETGRDLRYEFLLKTAKQAGATRIAVAHHGDDQVETVLYRIFRGTHWRGLSGMAPLRPMGEGAVLLCRPMLELTRKEIEAFCRAEGLVWMDDSSNADIRYRRNFLRREVLPRVRTQINPCVDESLRRLAEAAGEVEAYFLSQATPLLNEAMVFPSPLTLRIDRLRKQPCLLQKYVLRLAVERAGVPFSAMSSEHMDALVALLSEGGRVNLPGDYAADCQGSELRLAPIPRDASPTDWDVSLSVPGVTTLPTGEVLRCEIFDFTPEAFDAHLKDKPSGSEWLDADRVQGRLLIRNRRPGDRFTPLGAPGSVTVSDFLTNRKLPESSRGRACCLCDEAGLVLLFPFQMDERVRITEKTRRVLRVASVLSGA